MKRIGKWLYAVDGEYNNIRCHIPDIILYGSDRDEGWVVVTLRNKTFVIKGTVEELDKVMGEAK